MLRELLREFNDQVVVVEDSVSPECGITPHLRKHPDKVVHFRDLDGWEAVGNLWATRDRIARRLRTDFRGLKTLLLEAIEEPEPCEVLPDPPFMEVRDRADLLSLPIPKYFHGDGGRYISSGVVFAEWRGVRNASFHRMMVLDERRAAIRLVPRHLHRMYTEALREGEELRIAVSIGMPLPMLMAGAISVEYGVDEATIASAISRRAFGRPLAMAEVEGLLVPYDSEFVLVGRITEEKVDIEGPFVDITGTVDVKRDQPVVEFCSVYHVRNPIMHVLLPGGGEHYNLMGFPREATMLRAVRDAGVDVLDVRLTEGGCCWLHGVVKIKKRRPDDGVVAGRAALRGHRSMKHVVVVDEDIDIYDDRMVEWAIATRFQADRDLITLRERGSSLDPSADEGAITTKAVLDATVPLGEEERFRRVQ